MARALEMHANLVEADGGKPSTIASDREQQARLAQFWNDGGPEIARVQEVEVPGAEGQLGAILYEPTQEPTPVIVFLHGGGFARGTAYSADVTARALAATSGMAVLNLSYRLAPESPWPAALEDVDAVLDWCAAGDPLLKSRDFLLSGASAGAILALGVSLRRRDREKKAALGMALFYGAYQWGGDLWEVAHSRVAFGDGRYGLSKARCKDYFAWLKAPPTDPYGSPLRAMSLNNLPPIWLGVAELDVLRDDNFMLADRLKKSDTPFELVHYRGLTHGFGGRLRMVPRARRGVADAAHFLARCTAGRMSGYLEREDMFSLRDDT
ncbi:alpha/beta hydrolase [Bradyrhizobium sp. F1.13.3]|uniref:alpha/beta hydrolase n=1 Tax=Bradyrhizobium sp. F1.13.3 TaxID=3156351 RepID=UPI0033963A42